jgi:hypothetical protein
MTQNIYWCEEKGEFGGLYVIAPTRGRAKELYSAEIECRYIDVRTQIIMRGVNEVFPCVIDSVNTPLMKKYGLEYTEEEE